MFDESSDKMKLAPTRKKNWLLSFFYFFLRHYQKEEILFYKSVVILLKNRQNMLKLFLFSRHEPASKFFFYFLRHLPKTPVGIDPSNIEYSESALTFRYQLFFNCRFFPPVKKHIWLSRLTVIILYCQKCVNDIYSINFFHDFFSYRPPQFFFENVTWNMNISSRASDLPTEQKWI